MIFSSPLHIGSERDTLPVERSSLEPLWKARKVKLSYGCPFTLSKELEATRAERQGGPVGSSRIIFLASFSCFSFAIHNAATSRTSGNCLRFALFSAIVKIGSGCPTEPEVVAAVKEVRARVSPKIRVQVLRWVNGCISSVIL